MSRFDCIYKLGLIGIYNCMLKYLPSLESRSYDGLLVSKFELVYMSLDNVDDCADDCADGCSSGLKNTNKYLCYMYILNFFLKVLKFHNFDVPVTT